MGGSTRGHRTAVAVFLAVAVISSPALGAGEMATDRTKNLRRVEQVPIEMGTDQLAQGSDLAFRGNLVVAGAYEGAGLFKKTRQGLKQVSFYDCPGSQGDVSVWRHLMFISVDSAASNIGDTPLCNNTQDEPHRFVTRNRGHPDRRYL